MQAETNHKVRDRHAVVLAGGGSFGAFEVGVLKALANGCSPATDGKRLNAAIFTGTSVGAYNAAVLASKAEMDLNAAVKNLEDIWLNRISGELADNGVLRIRGIPWSLFDLEKLVRNRWEYISEATADAAFLSLTASKRLADFFASDSSLVDRTMEMLDFSSFISTEPLLKLIGETVSLAELNRSKRILKIAATNWVSGSLRIFVHDPFRDREKHKGRGAAPEKFSKEEPLTGKIWPFALLASTAIPGVFPAVAIDGSPHVDGGVVMNTPLRPAVDSGATSVHLICINPDASELPINNGLHIFERLMNLAVSATLNDDVEKIRNVNSMIEVSTELGFIRGYQQIAVHRYNPKIEMGGIASMLDFRLSSVRRRIEIGELTATNHDCAKEKCVLPKKGSPGASWQDRGFQKTRKGNTIP